MITQNNGVDGEHPNAGVVAGLRECADWLEQHPELPRAYYAQISFGYQLDTDARGRLMELALALGDRACEDRRWNEVEIRGEFGPVVVRASATKRALAAAPPVPEPEPIIPARSEAA